MLNFIINTNDRFLWATASTAELATIYHINSINYVHTVEIIELDFLVIKRSFSWPSLARPN